MDTLTAPLVPAAPVLAAGACSRQRVLASTFSTPPADPAGLLALWLAGRMARTAAAYRDDVRRFAHWAGADSPAAAVRALLAGGPGAANATALAYRAALTDAGRAPATIARALGALRSLVRMAHSVGLVTWAMDVPAPRVERRRDVRGPGRAGFRRLLDATAGDGYKAGRDRAILRLLHDVALRRAEVVGLDLAHVDLTAGTLAVLGKGHREREAVTLPPETAAALGAWIAARGSEPGPLFPNVDRAGKGGRLTAHGLYHLVRALGRAAGLTVRPHGLRHSAITAALDLTDGDVRRVARFARHRDVRTTMRYDDGRADLAGDVARLVAAAAGS